MTKTKHMLIMCSWSRHNPLVYRYVLPYVAMMQRQLGPLATIHLMTYETNVETPISSDDPWAMELAKMGVHWIPVRYAPLRMRGWWLYAKQIIAVRKYCLKNHIDIIHAFAPVAGAVAWLSSRWSSMSFVLDSWEPHAESMVETGVWDRSSLAFRILWWLEKRMAKDADYLIAAHPEMIDYASKKWGLTPHRVTYRPACVDLHDFNPQRFDKAVLRQRHGLHEDALICVCASQLGGMYYRDETLVFFATCRQHFGSRFRVRLITTTSEEDIRERSRALGLDLPYVEILRCAPSEVPEQLALADFALNPQQAVPSKKYGTPVKNGEYWAMGLPIVMMKDTSQDSTFALNYSTGVVLDDLTLASIGTMWDPLQSLLLDPQCSNRCRDLAIQTRSFAIAEGAYRQVYAPRAN